MVAERWRDTLVCQMSARRIYGLRVGVERLAGDNYAAYSVRRQAHPNAVGVQSGAMICSLTVISSVQGTAASRTSE